MEPGQFLRLVENFKTDGRMTGAVTVCQTDDGAMEILSGHHRTEAAIAAGFEEIEVVCITTPLSEQRKVAIQLSHNAISGQDNLNVLATMYEGLDLTSKKFSGLTDSVLESLGKLPTVAITSLVTDYQEILLAFLPEDKARLDAQIERLKSGSQKRPKLAARLADFDQTFETIVRVKHNLNVLNTALAILMMAELAGERLDQLENEETSGQTEAGTPQTEPR